MPSAATVQHTNTATRLKTRSSRNPNRKNKALPIMTTPPNLSSTWRKARTSFSGDFWEGGCWARGGGEREKESLSVQEHGGQPFRSPLALFMAFS
eukprot:1160428-Pelagomonas_calceolata.AAC.10